MSEGVWIIELQISQINWGWHYLARKSILDTRKIGIYFVRRMCDQKPYDGRLSSTILWATKGWNSP